MVLDRNAQHSLLASKSVTHIVHQSDQLTLNISLVYTEYMKKNRTLGFIGFLGFLGFVNPLFFIFFAFFLFFLYPVIKSKK